jgi:hypothetical protein
MKIDLRKHDWTSTPFNPRVYVAVHYSVVTFYFRNIPVFHIWHLSYTTNVQWPLNKTHSLLASQYASANTLQLYVLVTNMQLTNGTPISYYFSS